MQRELFSTHVYGFSVIKTLISLMPEIEHKGRINELLLKFITVQKKTNLGTANKLFEFEEEEGDYDSPDEKKPSKE